MHEQQSVRQQQIPDAQQKVPELPSAPQCRPSWRCTVWVANRFAPPSVQLILLAKHLVAERTTPDSPPVGTRCDCRPQRLRL